MVFRHYVTSYNSSTTQHTTCIIITVKGLVYGITVYIIGLQLVTISNRMAQVGTYNIQKLYINARMERIGRYIVHYHKTYWYFYE